MRRTKELLVKIRKPEPKTAYLIGNMAYCFTCRKTMRLSDKTINYTEMEEYYPLLQASTLQMREVERVCKLFLCDCCDKPIYIAYGHEETNEKIQSALDNGEIEVYRHSNSIDAKEGILENPTSGCLSLYTGTSYFVRNRYNKNMLIRIPLMHRISINPKTGAAYTCSMDGNHKKLVRNDWGNETATIWTTEKGLFNDYVARVVKASGLPIKIEQNGDVFDFICGKDRISISYQSNALQFLIDLITSPNVMIRHNSFTGKNEFRKNIRHSVDYACDVDELNLEKLILPEMTPVIKGFKKMQPKRLMDEGDFIRFICKELNLPTSRKFVKLYRKNPLIMGYVAFVMDMGIKENDNIYKMINALTKSDFRYSLKNPKSKTFIKNLIKQNGETLSVNKICNCRSNRSDFGDIVNMFSFVVNKNKEKVSLTGTLDEIHDRLSERYNKIKNKNVPIEYSKSEKDREADYGNVKINTAVDTDELIDIGTRMHICVGSYRNLVLSKKSTIYSVTDRNSRYVACIEMKGNRLVQAKGICNKMLEGSIARTIKNWVEEKRITSDRCYDFERLIENISEIKKPA